MQKNDELGEDGPALVEVSGLSRDYGPHAAVSELTFRLHGGEVLGFLGPNGAGKSTTMRMLAGVLAPSAGEIRIGGIDLLDEPRSAKRAIGYLPEIPPLYPELSVHEYLRYAAELHGVARQDLGDAVQDAMARCGLVDVSERLIGNLSKGYQQRVGIAQAIVHDPVVVILDEPTVGLDPIQIREIRELIHELGKQHTVILSTHILPEVQSVCSRVLIINHGRAVFSDSLAAMDARASRGFILDAARLPADETLAKAFPRIRIERISETRVRFLPQEDASLGAEQIAQQAAEGGWGLREIRNDNHSLEDIFAEVTAGDLASEPATDSTAASGENAA